MISEELQALAGQRAIRGGCEPMTGEISPRAEEASNRPGWSHHKIAEAGADLCRLPSNLLSTANDKASEKNPGGRCDERWFPYS